MAGAVVVDAARQWRWRGGLIRAERTVKRRLRGLGGLDTTLVRPDLPVHNTTYMVLIPKDKDVRMELANIIAEHNSMRAAHDHLVVPLLERSVLKILSAGKIQAWWRGLRARWAMGPAVHRGLDSLRAATVIQRQWNAWLLKDRLHMLSELRLFSRFIRRKKRKEMYLSATSLQLLDTARQAQHRSCPELNLDFYLDPYSALFICSTDGGRSVRAGIPDWIGTDIPVEKYSKFLLKDSTPVKRTELHKLLETGCEEVDLAAMKEEDAFSTMIPKNRPERMIRFQSEVEGLRRAAALFLLTWNSRAGDAARLYPNPVEKNLTPHVVPQSSELQVLAAGARARKGVLAKLPEDSPIPRLLSEAQIPLWQKKKNDWTRFSTLAMKTAEPGMGEVPVLEKFTFQHRDAVYEDYASAEEEEEEFEVEGNIIFPEFDLNDRHKREYKKRQHAQYLVELADAEKQHVRERQRAERERVMALMGSSEVAQSLAKANRSTNTSSVAPRNRDALDSKAVRKNLQDRAYLHALQARRTVKLRRAEDATAIKKSKTKLTGRNKEKVKTGRAATKEALKALQERGKEEVEARRLRVQREKAWKAAAARKRELSQDAAQSFVTGSNSLAQRLFEAEYVERDFLQTKDAYDRATYARLSTAFKRSEQMQKRAEWVRGVKEKAEDEAVVVMRAKELRIGELIETKQHVAAKKTAREAQMTSSGILSGEHRGVGPERRSLRLSQVVSAADASR